MWRRLLIAVVVLVVLVSGWFLWLLNAAGELKTLTAHFAGTCTPVSGVIGAEDITIHPRTGVAYLSAYDRRVPVGRAARGAIYAYDLNAPSPRVINVTPDADPDFRPHGISLYVAPDGASMLFVVNHPGDRHTIEFYDVGEGHLTHRRTLSDPLLVHPNDLLAVTPTEVYAPSDHRDPRAPSQVLHVVPLPSGGYRVDEVYLDLGEQLSAASVAAVRGKRLLIGPIADSKFLDCQMR